MHLNKHSVIGMTATVLGLGTSPTGVVRTLACGLFLGLLGAPLLAPAVVLYVSPPPVGVAGNPCTLAAPCPLVGDAVALSSAGDVISVAAGTYQENNITLPHNLAIIGASALTTEIDGQGLGRLLAINANLVIIDRLTLRNGNAGVGNGGAIELTGGALIMTRARVLDNLALAGGAIAHTSSGQLLVSASTLQGNTGTSSGGAIWCENCGGVNLILGRLVDNAAGGFGGAIYARGSQVITRLSSLSRNNADIGGALYAWEEAEVHLLDSEVSENTAGTGDGGAVYLSGTLNIERSTLAENSAVTGNGGAVYLNNQGIFTSANSTYSSNSASCGGALFTGVDADVLIGTATFFNNTASFAGCPEHIISNALSFELYNSIIANDLSGGAVFDPYCSAPLTGGSNNRIDDNACDTGGASFNLGAVTGLATTLAYNGGPTRTHTLLALPLSNAVDAGNNAACLNPWSGTALVIDQRGRPRPVDHPPLLAGGGGAICDIGAVELQ